VVGSIIGRDTGVNDGNGDVGGFLVGKYHLLVDCIDNFNRPAFDL
jgi:hypothetical protein